MRGLPLVLILLSACSDSPNLQSDAAADSGPRDTLDSGSQEAGTDPDGGQTDARVDGGSLDLSLDLGSLDLGSLDLGSLDVVSGAPGPALGPTDVDGDGDGGLSALLLVSRSFSNRKRIRPGPPRHGGPVPASEPLRR